MGVTGRRGRARGFRERPAGGPLGVGEEVVLTGESLAYGGETACRTTDGFVVFVPGLAPGETARVRVRHARRSFARGGIVERLARGPDQVAPPCAAFGVCGGCQWQQVSLSSQRKAKEAIVRHLLEPLGAAGCVRPIRGSGDGLAYRHRLILPVGSGPGGIVAGFYRAGTHDLVPVEACPVQRRELWDAAAIVLRAARESSVSGYNERTGEGDLRHLVMRMGSETGEIGVVLVTARSELPRAGRLVEAATRNIPALAGVIHNVNPRRTNVILGPEDRLLHGRATLREAIRGLRFRSAITGFMQANPDVAGELHDLLADWCRGEKGGLLDLYCGAGLLGLAAARCADPAWLVGVEGRPAAVEDARANAEARPGLECRFDAADAARWLSRPPCDLQGLGTVIVDPPRKGLAPEALRGLSRLAARRIVYVSCDPPTFTRDLAGLMEAGFAAREVVPLDMFPQTYHIELAALLERNTGP